MTKLANGQESTVLVPVVVIPVKVEFALGTVPIEVGNVTIAVAIHPDGAVKIYKISSVPPPFEYSPGCILFGKVIPLIPYTKYFHFWSNVSAL
ncbi:MAG: hypothetical protein UU40_C0017G0002 [Candidatus Uhrbacteria bacterium GW2011_GWD2_41_121]|uniref:Uncharacterized protein n=1 Tax=Candidatus Uhrbacteria bacterium GW2011_GWC1_41_20 TaxID=1618983 RepID=A0A0G0VDN9_9BACT|nr:MAG: hypothetical protein UT52_C0017G0022 [Candidatus Uhrbacteria bacterium GW2011_GWE1_39_46]KKR63474.1 MAG: hypothetical protein UU04_C0017G0002 [Candidatus Uhrbacteria bacterium GW2011_GWC2_40_450]KKR89688.1 MAG: hypothetical protein UU40_C0017G0002 [Candidatus Uhrbacteria bacterium GW2011_GWD2_41_121]KKR99009.1 MAG: hypothetical protein UU50_C0012G0057 [Candidatus Uhrbacteria bacterium GW2011_GWC1_41_20]KKS07199.1 MAG: hypothetical protein UU62_C0020G0002 [Candidatus Uhrbacteria bacteriu